MDTNPNATKDTQGRKVLNLSPEAQSLPICVVGKFRKRMLAQVSSSSLEEIEIDPKESVVKLAAETSQITGRSVNVEVKRPFEPIAAEDPPGRGHVESVNGQTSTRLCGVKFRRLGASSGIILVT
ncbi:hypothetical protein TNCV_2340791 [Trichonephila clavipes]|nr:hypothetical protein TNCV_2340791 [Trichonephila clavipes]